MEGVCVSQRQIKFHDVLVYMRLTGSVSNCNMALFRCERDGLTVFGDVSECRAWYGPEQISGKINS